MVKEHQTVLDAMNYLLSPPLAAPSTAACL